MAPPAKKKKFTIRFELGILGLFGLLVVCAAIFFWMFLLGLWAGQSVFTPISAGVSPFARFASPFEGRGGEPPLPALAEPQRDGGQEVVSLPVASAGEEPAGEGAAEPTFFALQVSAFREAERAERDAEQWRGLWFRPRRRMTPFPESMSGSSTGSPTPISSRPVLKRSRASRPISPWFPPPGCKVPDGCRFVNLFFFLNGYGRTVFRGRLKSSFSRRPAPGRRCNP